MREFKKWLSFTKSIQLALKSICHIVLLVGFMVMNSFVSIGQDTPDFDPRLEALEALSYDSIQKIYLANVFLNADSSLKIIKVYEDKALNENNPSAQVMGMNLKSLAYILKSELDSASVQLESAISLCKTFDDSEELLSKTHINYGNLHLNREDYLEAFRNYQKGLPYFKEHNIKEGISKIKNNVGIIYHFIRDYEKAIESFLESKSINKELPNYQPDGNVDLNLGWSNLMLKKYHEAMTYLNSAEVLFRKSNNTLGLSDCLIHQAKCYVGLGLEDEAEQLLNEAIDITTSSKLDDGTIRAKLALADLMVDRKPSKAEKLLGDVDILLKGDLLSNTYLASSYELKSKVLKKEGYFEDALLMYEKYKSYSDSVEMDIGRKDIISQTIKQEYEDILYEENQKFETEKEKIKLEQKNRISLILLGSFLLLVLGGIFTRKRLKNHSNKQRSLLNEIEDLKANQKTSTNLQTDGFHLDRSKIEQKIQKKLNETDWKVMNILLEDPVITNKEIAKKAFLSVDGIGSSLRRMYQTFDIKESRYMKISLLMELIKISS